MRLLWRAVSFVLLLVLGAGAWAVEPYSKFDYGRGYSSVVIRVEGGLLERADLMAVEGGACLQLVVECASYSFVFADAAGVSNESRWAHLVLEQVDAVFTVLLADDLSAFSYSLAAISGGGSAVRGDVIHSGGVDALAGSLAAALYETGHLASPAGN